MTLDELRGLHAASTPGCFDRVTGSHECMKFFAAAHNNLIRIVDRLERAERERDAMTHTLDVSGFDLGNAQSWLDARDKRMKALGAAETWKKVASQAVIRGDIGVAAYANEQAALAQLQAEEITHG